MGAPVGGAVVKKMSSCCDNHNGICSAAADSNSDDDIYASVQEYYGKVLCSSKDLKTSACTAGGRPHPVLLRLMARLPQDVTDRFYGCGAPVPLGIEGLRVLDLGSGSGRDCYLAAALVGPRGRVTGLDMTPEQLAIARQHAEGYCRQTLGYAACNMEFVQGHMELLEKAGIEEGAYDLIISNCVVNLSPNKGAVLRGAYRALAPGGEMYFSDVYCDRRVPEEARKDEVLWGECVSGALYINDFMRTARAAGFAAPIELQKSPIAISDPAMNALLGNARFYSITYRLFKLPGLLEDASEDYGQVAVYKGTIQGHEHAYMLASTQTFEKGRHVAVCGNTAAMLGEGGMSHLAPHFQVIGDRSIHFGAFGVSTASVDPAAHSAAASSCC